MWSQPYFWITWLLVACFMEFWAMFLHGILWHGPWWLTHRSHHRESDGFFEFNDIFSIIHAAIATGLIIYGFESGNYLSSHLCIAVGFGMTTFGIAYFIVHDGFIHQRLPVSKLSKIPYLRRVRNAHLVHHKEDHHLPYGLFLGEYELRWAKKLRKRLK